MTNNLKFKRSDYHSGYVAELPNGDFYHVEKTERILLGRFGGGTTHTFWKADYVKVDADATVNKYTRIPLLVGSKYAPTEFTSKIGDTKREAVIACQGHADGADNVQH